MKLRLWMPTMLMRKEFDENTEAFAPRFFFVYNESDENLFLERERFAGGLEQGRAAEFY